MTTVFGWHSQSLQIRIIDNDISPTIPAAMGGGGGASMTCPVLIVIEEDDELSNDSG